MAAKRIPIGKGLAAFTLLALALVAKAIVPSGWMPTFENGRFAFELCGGWTPKPAATLVSPTPAHNAASGAHGDHHAGASSSGPQDHKQHEGGDQRVDQPCSFAATSLAWTPPPIGRPNAPQPATTPLSRHLLRSVSVALGLVAPPPPATGPPRFT